MITTVTTYSKIILLSVCTYVVFVFCYIYVQEIEGIKPLCSLQITPNVKVMQIVDLGTYVSEYITSRK